MRFYALKTQKMSILPLPSSRKAWSWIAGIAVWASVWVVLSITEADFHQAPGSGNWPAALLVMYGVLSYLAGTFSMIK
jgi:hypothetical protein